MIGCRSVALGIALLAFSASTADAQDAEGWVTVVSTPSAPRCGGAGLVAVALDVRLSEDVAEVGREGEVIRVVAMCPLTPSEGDLRRGIRPRGFRGIWPGEAACLHFLLVSQLPRHDGLFAEPGGPPRYFVTRTPDDRCE